MNAGRRGQRAVNSDSEIVHRFGEGFGTDDNEMRCIQAFSSVRQFNSVQRVVAVMELVEI